MVVLFFFLGRELDDFSKVVRVLLKETHAIALILQFVCF